MPENSPGSLQHCMTHRRGVIYGTERNHYAQYAVLDRSMGVNEMRVKILPFTVSVKVGVKVRVSLV